MKGNGVYPDLCNVDSLARAVSEMNPVPQGPLWQVNHFVGSKKVPLYAVFYDGPVWITELYPTSYSLLLCATVPNGLRKDPRIRCGTYLVPIDVRLSWKPVTKRWYAPETLFRLVPNGVGAVVLHKEAQTACNVQDFEAGYASWTEAQTDIFVPKSVRRAYVQLGVLARFLNPAQTQFQKQERRSIKNITLKEEEFLETDTPRIVLSKYSSALCLSEEQILAPWI